MITLNIGLRTSPAAVFPVVDIHPHIAVRELDTHGFTVVKQRLLLGGQNDERTLVCVVLDDVMDGTARARLYKVAEALHQDCIAVAVNFGSDGHFAGSLVGPRAINWGRFDPEKFVTWRGVETVEQGIAFKEAA